MRRQCEDFHAWLLAPELFGGLCPAHPRHRHVEHGDVGLRRDHAGDRARPVVGFTDNLHIRLRIDQPA